MHIHIHVVMATVKLCLCVDMATMSVCMYMSTVYLRMYISCHSFSESIHDREAHMYIRTCLVMAKNSTSS